MNKKKKIIILGSGLVGGPMARDLAEEFDVSLADINAEALKKAVGNYNIKSIETDLSREETIRKLVQGFDLVINAVPGHMGFTDGAVLSMKINTAINSR